MQIDPATGGDVERGLGQQRPVGDDRAAVRGDLPQPCEEVLVARPDGLQHLDPGFLGALRDGAGDQSTAASGRSVGAGDDGGHFVPAGGDQGVQGGYGYLGGACEDELHGWLTASQAETYGDEQRTSLRAVP